MEQAARAGPGPKLLGLGAGGVAEEQTWGVNCQPGPETAEARLTAAFEVLASAVQAELQLSSVSNAGRTSNCLRHSRRGLGSLFRTS